MTSPRMLPLLLLAVLSLIWGSSFILMKFGLYALQWHQVAALRLTISMTVTLPFILKYIPKMNRRDFFWVCLGGFIGNGIPAYIFPGAETELPSAIAGVLNSLSPLFVMITGWLMFQAKLPGLKIAGVFIGLAGAVVMALVNAEATPPGSNRLLLGGLVVFATFLYGLSTNISKYKMAHMAPIQIAGFAFLFTGIPSAIWLFTQTDFIHIVNTHPDAFKSVAAVATLSIVGSALALVLFYRLLQISTAAGAASVTYLMPIVALGWGMLDGEKLAPLHLAGIAAIIVGVYLVNLKKLPWEK